MSISDQVSMFDNSSPNIIERAKMLWNNMTLPEVKLEGRRMNPVEALKYE